MRRRRRFVLLAASVACSIVVPSTIATARPRPAKHRTATVAPVVCGDESAPLKADGTPYRCSFDDEFDGSTLNTTQWLPLTTAKNGVKAGGGCFVNDPDNIGVADGSLHLTVQQETAPFVCKSPKGYFYTSVTAGQVTTSGKFAQKYGRFSIRAKFPAAAPGGIHSALWLWPQDPYTSGLVGEIDVAEVYSALNDRAIPYLHYRLDKTTVDLTSGMNVFTNNYCMINDVTQYHTYTLDWSPGTLTISYDDQICLTDHVLSLGPSPFDQQYFLSLTESLGVGANAPTLLTPLPSTMDIDWVRVWK
jgi:beta-glucanase (GH16 family)